MSRLDPILALQTLAVVPGLDVGLKIVGFRRANMLAEALAHCTWPLSTRVDDISRSIDVVCRRYRPTKSCLSRALWLSAVLRRCEHDVELDFGVQREGGGFSAHARVLHGGREVGIRSGEFTWLGRTDAVMPEAAGRAR